MPAIIISGFTIISSKLSRLYLNIKNDYTLENDYLAAITENGIWIKDAVESRNIIINALDNIKARRFVDNECFKRQLPLFESGTMGLKGNTQPVIPFLTETKKKQNIVFIVHK